MIGDILSAKGAQGYLDFKLKQMKMIKLNLILFTTLSLFACKQGTSSGQQDGPAGDITSYLTKGDKTALLEKQPTVLNFSEDKVEGLAITVDESQTFQEMDGFGYTLTGGSADLIASLPDAGQDSLIQELFSHQGDAIRVNYLRLSIGASDLSASTFTYNEVPAGESDPELKHFSIEKEKESLIPVLKKILKINPAIKILGSPWTAPTWMKTNGAYKGGSLKKEYYQSYAQYFVKYVEAMKQEGITIDAITIQNEPLHPGNTPSMYMEAKDQAEFIKSALGPAFKRAGISTKIIVYDHNADRPDYPMDILADKDAAQYVDGSAFHLYGGKIDALSKVHDAYPEKHIYFTEQWVGGPGNFPEDLTWHVSTLIIGATRHWSRNVLEWNLAADANYDPHTPDGGCTSCLGAITIQGGQVERNVAYYIIGHASKFVPTGSKRISSNLVADLPNVAFLTPDGEKVLIVVNNGDADKTFYIANKNKQVVVHQAAGSVATYVWQ